MPTFFIMSVYSTDSLFEKHCIGYRAMYAKDIIDMLPVYEACFDVDKIEVIDGTTGEVKYVTDSYVAEDWKFAVNESRDRFYA